VNRSLTLPFFGTIVLAVAAAAAGCNVQGSQPAPSPPPPYGAYPYPPPPPYAAAQIARTEGALRASVRATPPPPAPNILSQIDPNALAIVARIFPKGCAAFQAAPGEFVHLDCRRYAPIAGARTVNSANLLRLFQAGQLRLDPGITSTGAGAISPPLLLQGLESLLGINPAPAPSPSPSPSPAPSPPAPSQLPASVDHRTLGIEGPVKDQGVVGSCTAFSLSSVMDNAIRRLNSADVVSAMHVWSRYADPTMQSAESRSENHALSLWSDYPYDQSVACRMETQDDGCAELLVPRVQVNTAAGDPTVQAQIRNADARGRYTITEIDQITPIDPDALALELATGRDVWLALGVSQDAWTNPVVQATGIVPDWLIEDGGHAVALAGYRATPVGRQFLVHNSWGQTWGQGGYAWISEAMIRGHSQFAYTITVLDRAAPPPPPTPVPAPQPNGPSVCPAGYTQVAGLPLCQHACTTSADCGAGGSCVSLLPGGGAKVCVGTNPSTDDDCGEGQLVDIVSGRCGPACANGLRPVAGVCPFGR
jgi:hypothetical protein